MTSTLVFVKFLFYFFTFFSLYDKLRCNVSRLTRQGDTFACGNTFNPLRVC